MSKHNPYDEGQSEAGYWHDMEATKVKDKADQIERALQHITTSGGDLDLETDLALKALAADYERLKWLYDDCCRCNGDLMKTAVSKGIELDDIAADYAARGEEIERLKTEIAALLAINQAETAYEMANKHL